MRDYVIITDSTCDLPQKFVDENNIVVIPLQFNIDGKDYRNYLDGREMTNEEFYNLERQGKIGKTAQLTMFDITEVYRSYLEKGYDILGLGFSSGLSGTFNSMRLAVEELKEEFSDAKINIIDTLCASTGEGLFVYYANLYKKQGMSIDDNTEALLKLRPHLCHWFTVLSLDTVVGVHPNGEDFKLDLHEKFHGPHGLIAGSTGSGKSEFIITYILSMAINITILPSS